MYQERLLRFLRIEESRKPVGEVLQLQTVAARRNGNRTNRWFRGRSSRRDGWGTRNEYRREPRVSACWPTRSKDVRDRRLSAQQAHARYCLPQLQQLGRGAGSLRPAVPRRPGRRLPPDGRHRGAGDGVRRREEVRRRPRDGARGVVLRGSHGHVVVRRGPAAVQAVLRRVQGFAEDPREEGFHLLVWRCLRRHLRGIWEHP